jgi:CRISPR-associated protein Cas5d
MVTLGLEVRGDYACFTRPELKVERVSYDVMTPSAARAIFEAILWKPAIWWDIERVEVLAPIEWASMRRNEVGSKVPTTSVVHAMTLGRGSLALFADDDRQQRAGVVLRDVAYRIWATPVLTALAGPGENITKFVDMFRRRASHGQCVNQPYLGCREFACRFDLIHDDAVPKPPITESRDLGIMLYDLDFSDREMPKPLFFRAALEQGVLRVPRRDSVEVLG